MGYARYGVRIRNSLSMLIDGLVSVYTYVFVCVSIKFYSNLPFLTIKRADRKNWIFRWISDKRIDKMWQKIIKKLFQLLTNVSNDGTTSWETAKKIKKRASIGVTPAHQSLTIAIIYDLSASCCSRTSPPKQRKSRRTSVVRPCIKRRLQIIIRSGLNNDN